MSSWGTDLSLAVVFVLCAICFQRVLTYGLREARAHRLINSAASPPRWIVSGRTGSTFVTVVLVFLFEQSQLFMILVVVMVSVFLMRSRRTAREQFGLDRLSPARILGWSFLLCGAVIFVVFPLTALLDWGMTAVHLPHPEQESVDEFQQATRPIDIFLFLVQAVLISPLIEEIFFRGFLFTFLKNYTSTILALVLSAGIFAFAHANLGSTLPLWILGLMLGLAYEHTGSLLLPIGIHACWNLLTALSLLLQRGNS